MIQSIQAYLRLILTKKWISAFFNVKTQPLETPDHFRDVPKLTGRGCTHCYLCMSVCPVPGAIEVLKEGKPAVWNPRIYPGHCIRCGFCVEICPEIVLESGRIWKMVMKKDTFLHLTCHIQVNTGTCMGCGICSVACPINRQIDPQLASKGTSTSEEVIMRVESGVNTVFHEEKCTGCKTCEEECPNHSIKVARVMQAGQMVYEDWDDEE